MRWLRASAARLMATVARRRKDDELAIELDAHLQAHIDDNIRAGMTPEEARRQALIALGGLPSTIESYRDQQSFAFVETTMQDIRYALRLLWKSPAYTLAAVAALAVGIGANTTVFSVVNGVLLKALPYEDPARLVLLYEQLPNALNRIGFSPPDFEFVRDQARSYSALGAYFTRTLELSGSVTPQRVNSARVSPGVFSALGVEPIHGRLLREDDDRQNARVTVVSYGLWTRAFGRDPSIVGNTITLDGRSYMVVGVMPERFVFPPRGSALNGAPADVFWPMSFLPFERQAFGMMYNFTLLGRLKPGVSVDQARAELSSLVPATLARYPAPIQPFVKRLTMPLAPMQDDTVAGGRRLILVLMGAVGFVLLISCADVASLMLTRSAARQRELAIRRALGATRARIVRQLLTEAVVLAGVGTTAGIALAYGLMRALLILAAGRLPHAESIAFDGRIVAFALALAVVTPIVFGLVPALRAVRSTHDDAIAGGARHLAAGRRKAWVLGSLVIGQVALALMLSVGASLLVRSFVRLLQSDAGFSPERSVRATVVLPIGRYTPPTVAPFYSRALDAVRAVPGVTAAGAGDLPLASREGRAFTADASARPDRARVTSVTWTSGAYFDALGVPLKGGRWFSDADTATSQRVAIVNERLARLTWPDRDPIGRQIKWGIDVPQNQSAWMTVVGVVADVKQNGLDAPAATQVYVPLVQDDTSGGIVRTLNLIVRSSRDPVALAADLRGAVQRLDSSLPVTVQTLAEMVGDSAKPQRFTMTVMTAFASVALLLAALGIYGVLANAVAQQTQEIGVRVALGATAFNVMWMVLRRALTLMAIGVAIGIGGAFGLARTLAGLLFDTAPTDAASFAGAIAALALIALIASLAPAWRATRVDPIVALQSD